MYHLSINKYSANGVAFKGKQQWQGGRKKPPSKGRKLNVDLRFLGFFSCMFQNAISVSFNIVKQHWLPKKSPSVLGVLLLMAKKKG